MFIHPYSEINATVFIWIIVKGRKEVVVKLVNYLRFIIEFANQKQGFC